MSKKDWVECRGKDISFSHNIKNADAVDYAICKRLLKFWCKHYLKKMEKKMKIKSVIGKKYLDVEFDNGDIKIRQEKSGRVMWFDNVYVNKKNHTGPGKINDELETEYQDFLKSNLRKFKKN